MKDNETLDNVREAINGLVGLGYDITLLNVDQKVSVNKQAQSSKAVIAIYLEKPLADVTE